MQALAVPKISSITFSPRPLRRGTDAYAPGSALISALIFTVIIALALAGMGTLTVSHYNRASIESTSSEALDIAEAGINWELHKITKQGIASADTGGTYNASPNIADGLPGTYTIACATLDGSALDANTKMFTITSAASIRTATGQPAKRIVRINAQPYSTFYTLYSSSSTNFTDNGIVVDGISGTNGAQNITSGLTVKPKIKNLVFNGPSKPTDPVYDGYNMVSNPKPVPIQGITDKVNAQFAGGSNYLKSNNDNNLAVRNDPANPPPPGSPPPQAISSDKFAMSATGYQTVTLKGKPGGANYYLTDINMDGNSNLIFDNTNGPINIYYLNLSGGGIHMRGGHSLKSLDEAPDNKVKMFASSVGAIVLSSADPMPGVANSTEIDMGIYDFDSYVYKGKTYTVGQVNVGPDVNFRGQVISKIINIGATTNVTGQQSYFDTPTEYYGFSGVWTELNGAGTAGGANQ